MAYPSLLDPSCLCFTNTQTNLLSGVGERSKQSSYSQSCMGRFDRIQTAVNSLEKKTNLYIWGRVSAANEVLISSHLNTRGQIYYLGRVSEANKDLIRSHMSRLDDIIYLSGSE